MDPIYSQKGKKIGDDGFHSGKIYIVYNDEQIKTIKESTGPVNLNGIDKVTLNGGRATVRGVIASVRAGMDDTAEDAEDAGLHEEGGHTEKNADYSISTVAWAPGPKRDQTGHGSIDMFNGLPASEIPPASELLDLWHIHTSKKTEIQQSDGTVKTYKGSMTPSGDPTGTDYRGDIGQARSLRDHNYTATSIQVGTSSGKKVNFYNGQGLTTSMSYKNFKRLSK